MTRSEILKRADEIINGQREQDYGSAERNFGLIGQLWTVYLDHLVTAADVANMMCLFKVARIKTGRGTEDSYIDAAGYMACGGEIATAAKDEKPKDYLKTVTDAMKPKYTEFLKGEIEKQTEGKHISAGIKNGPFVPSYPPKEGVKCCCTDKVSGDAYNPPRTITRDEARERADKLGKGAILIHKREDGIIVNVLWNGITTVGLSDEKRPEFVPKHMAFADIDEAIEYYDKHRKKPHSLENLLKLISICAKLRKVTEEMEDMGVASPVVSINVEYKKQVEFDDKVEIRLSVSEYNGAVLEIEYEFYNLSKDEVCSHAVSRHCFIHGDRLVSLNKELPRLDADLREQLDL